MPSKTRIRIGVVLAALIALVVLVFVLLEGEHEDDVSPAGDAREPASTGAVSSRLPRPHAPEAPPPASDVAFLQATKAKYLESAVYPPWSRPATAAYAKHAWWNEPQHVDVQFDDDAEAPVQVRLTLDKLQYRPDESAVATLRVWRGGPDSEQSAIDFAGRLRLQTFDEERARRDREEEVQPLTMAGWQNVLDLPFESAGNPPNERVVTFVPSQAIAAAAHGIEDGSPRILADVVLRTPDTDDEEAPDSVSERQRFLTLPIRIATAEPIVVLDKVSERVVNGSLEIEFAVEVKRVGKVSMRTTLWNADGTFPIAIYDGPFSAPSTARPSAAGRQVIKVIFFGRALRQAGIDGPYEISPLRGQVSVSDPPATLWFRDDRRWTTKAYKAQEFADSEWDDEHKQQMIETYDRLIEEAGGPPG